MKPDEILAAVTTLGVTDTDGCDRVALSELAGLVRQVRSWLDAVEATVAKPHTTSRKRMAVSRRPCPRRGRSRWIPESSSRHESWPSRHATTGRSPGLAMMRVLLM